MTDHYPRVESKPDFPSIEERVLESWAAEGTFVESVTGREAGPNGDNEYVFYDGPPFANGLPHYGHLLTSYVKDVIPRYQTMRGHRVERRFGWDCHGLPAEMAAEKELGVSGRRNITDYGIGKFNAYCRESVMRYTTDWQRYIDRQARWVDFENEYKTMDLSYMESVMWAFKTLWDQGLLYEAHRVMPYSWGAETPLSNFEIRLDDATRPRQDPAITVLFDLSAADGDPGPMSILAWTTTPWTLPSNLALAVGPDIDYVVMEDRSAGDPRYVVLGQETLTKYSSQFESATLHGTVRGSELVGRTYRPLFDYFADHPNAFRILGADFVDTSDGTGVVHIAPGFGEDDQLVGEAAGISVVVPVDDEGRFTAEVPDWEGENVFEANAAIIAHLKAQHRVVLHETYDHNYPHCWRTDTPIIYRALSSWYVEVTAIRERMLELNQEINWIPEHVRDGRFGKWLEGARDWSISRNRFWGSPIPVWKSDDPTYPRIDVYGSLDELERDFGVRPTDLHRPQIDELVRPNPDDPTGQSMMRRVPEVLDCWFESGSMPFAQVHYPFENKDWFEDHFPADFIVEYINQTRGWFYTLHVLATALFDKPAFKNVICHGILSAADGAKLSKRHKNYPDPERLFSEQGADALRWYLMSSPIVRGGDLRIKEEEIADVTRLVINPIWNAYSFFALYANADGIKAELRSDSPHRLDRYILAKTRELLESVTERLDGYDLPGACAEITPFLDALNNWYIRRSRERFWAPTAQLDAQAKADAYNTLYTVLVTLTKLTAPLLPILSEEIHRGLTGEPSVHLTDWPDPEALRPDPELVASMDRVREVCRAALGIREEAGIAARVPLRSLQVSGAGATALEPFAELIAEQVNVKQVALDDELGDQVQIVLKPDGKVLGPKLGKGMQAVLAAAKVGSWSTESGGRVRVADIVLEPGEFELTIDAGDETATAVLRTNDAVVRLDTNVTAALRSEGQARHVVRVVQQGRRDRGLQVTDRIRLVLDLPDELDAAAHTHVDYIANQVLATDVQFSDLAGSTSASAVTIDGFDARFDLSVS